MNYRATSTVVFAGALSWFPLTPLSAAKPSLATMYQVTAIEKYGAPLIATGDPLQKVRRYLGTPNEELSANVWVYFDFIPSHIQAKADACTTVVITFSDGRIVDIKGVNRGALTILASRLGTSTGDPTLVAKAK
jgi:hypothetical protein